MTIVVSSFSGVRKTLLSLRLIEHLRNKLAKAAFLFGWEVRGAWWAIPLHPSKPHCITISPISRQPFKDSILWCIATFCGYKRNSEAVFSVGPLSKSKVRVNSPPFSTCSPKGFFEVCGRGITFDRLKKGNSLQDLHQDIFSIFAGCKDVTAFHQGHMKSRNARTCIVGYSSLPSPVLLLFQTTFWPIFTQACKTHRS